MESHSTIKKYFDKIDSCLKQHSGAFTDIQLPFNGKSNVDDEWVNRYYESNIFRHIHLEYYKTNKICVLHSNSFPNILADVPIMGFDLIALGNKITGLFFDFTPVSEIYPSLKSDLINLKFKFKSQIRPLPEWANFFSENFYCASPLEEELDEIISDICKSINRYFEEVNIKFEHLTQKNIEIQNEYCKGQKKNEKTFNALAVEIGKDNAKLFLDNYLFPEIDFHK
jgi:hypothetical protein